jgi:hypothetical protein
MTISKLKLLVLTSAVIGLTTSMPANAGFASGNSVTMAGSSIFQILGSADGVSAEHRAWQTQDALDNALVLAQNRSPSAVSVSRENGAITVLLDGRRVATADSSSAAMENMTAAQLAEKWAESIKGFLSDQDRTANYVATLIKEHKVKATVVFSERTLFAPAGFTFPITLGTGFALDTVKVGDKIQATLDRDAPLGSYVIAAGSLLSGEVIADQSNSNFGIRFTSLRTPNGTVIAIDATVTDNVVIGTSVPHLVSTQVIPAGSANGLPYVECRVPAGIGAGTVNESDLHLFVFRQGSGSIAVGRSLNLVFEQTTPVAVIMRDTTL